MERENEIKQTTIDLLLREGKFDITVNDIAEKSKVSRTVIHYYYRSKENLFAAIMEDIIKKYMIPRYECLFIRQDLKSKVESYLNLSENILKKYPYTDIYVMTQISESLNLQKYVRSMEDSMQAFISEIEEAVAQKTVRSFSANEFMIDLFSLSNFPGLYYNFLKVSGSTQFPKTQNDFFEGRTQNILKRLFES